MKHLKKFESFGSKLKDFFFDKDIDKDKDDNLKNSLFDNIEDEDAALGILNSIDTATNVSIMMTPSSEDLKGGPYNKENRGYTFGIMNIPIKIQRNGKIDSYNLSINIDGEYSILKCKNSTKEEIFNIIDSIYHKPQNDLNNKRLSNLNNAKNRLSNLK